MCSLEAVKFDFFFDLFKFRETNPFMSVIKNGEEVSDYANAGYDSANFFLLLGPIVPLILIFLNYHHYQNHFCGILVLSALDKVTKQGSNR